MPCNFKTSISFLSACGVVGMRARRSFDLIARFFRNLSFLVLPSRKQNGQIVHTSRFIEGWFGKLLKENAMPAVLDRMNEPFRTAFLAELVVSASTQTWPRR